MSITLLVFLLYRVATANNKSEVKLEAQFRVNVSDDEQFEKFLSNFSQASGASGTFYNKKNQIDRSGKKTVLFKIRKCIHNILYR